jgi:DNA polymerase III delta subunit-like protein
MTPDQVRAALAGDLPPATLVLGPGAWDVVGGGPPDPDWIRRRDLDADMARQVCEVAGWASVRGRQVFALNLDGASRQVQDMLLKVLEEPPATTRFVLTATSAVLLTVRSRCRVLVLSGQPPVPDDARERTAVGTAIQAARSGQAGLLAQAVRGWEPAHARLLASWAAEAATGRWRRFSPDFAPGVQVSQALQLAAELGRYQGARLGALVALERVFCAG